MSKKHDDTTSAADMYQSTWFRKAREYAEIGFDRWYILSAKYGLLKPTDVIAPYDQTLKTMSDPERHKWATRVEQQLRAEPLTPQDTVTILLGERYRSLILPILDRLSIRFEIPMRGLGIGRQVHWLGMKIGTDLRLPHLRLFYSELVRLAAIVGGPRRVADCSGSLGWPKRGVYFFFEPTETSTYTDALGRVVRVGTHSVSKGSKSTLWGRIRTHRGAGDGAGNHRGSIFRLHVGAALLAQSNGVSTTWGRGQDATTDIRIAERDLELLVSSYIGNMTVLWLPVDDAPSARSDRAFIEQNAIALLAGLGKPADTPSTAWLGNSSPIHSIRDSGLWNVNYTDFPYDPRFLGILRQLITLAASPAHADHSIAPHDWYSASLSRRRRQLTLFE